MPVLREDVFTRAIRRAETIAEECGTDRPTLLFRIIGLMESAGSRTNGATFENNALYAAIMLLAELKDGNKFEMGRGDYLTMEQYAALSKNLDAVRNKAAAAEPDSII